MSGRREFEPVKRASNKSAFLEEDDSQDHEPAQAPTHHHHDGRRCNHDHHEEREPLRNRGPAQDRAGSDERERELQAEKEKVLETLRFQDAPVSNSTSLVSLVYPLVSVLLAYTALAYQESLVTDEMYVKFHENLDRYNKLTEISGPMILAEFIKFFSVCAYDVLVVMYLIKPLRSTSSEVAKAHPGKETHQAVQRHPRQAQGRPERPARPGHPPVARKHPLPEDRHQVRAPAAVQLAHEPEPGDVSGPRLHPLLAVHRLLLPQPGRPPLPRCSSSTTSASSPSTSRT